MEYKKTLVIPQKEAEAINHHLHVEPTCADECLGEDITISNTVIFENGIEMDIKCCGVQYEEENESNTAWTEAVLFFENGSEICCSEPSDEYFGEWILEDEEDVYIVIVKEEEQTNEKRK